MKKVIFICLLTFSVCLSKPDTQPSAPVTQQVAQNATEAKTETPAKIAETTLPHNDTKASSPTVSEAQSASTAHVTASTPAIGTSTDENNTTKNKTATEKVTEPPKGNVDNQTAAAKETTSTNKPEKAVTNETKTEGDKNNSMSVSTPKSDVSKSTETPSHDAVQPAVQARAFDGPSFFGGIILTLGLLAVGFMGLKYYKNQTERNYHTL